MKKITLLSGLLFSFFISSYGQNTITDPTADEKADPIKARFLIASAAEFGGESLATIYFDDNSSQEVHIGQGVTFAIGGEFEFTNIKYFFIRTTLGYKFVTTKATNVDISLSRIPIKLTAHWNVVKKLCIGGGLAVHTGIKFKGGGLVPNVNFETATGPIFEISYGGLGISYTLMNYKAFGESFSANSFGLTFVLPLPKKTWRD